MAELDDYLEGEHAETRLDSRGHFTLSLPQAREKFAAFGGQLPCGFVLKLVQAACLLGAERVLLDEPHGQLVLTVEFEAEKMDLDDFFSQFETYLLGTGERWQGYLGRALLGAYDQTSHPSFLAIWNGKAYSQVVSFPSGAEVQNVRLVREPSLKHGLTWQMETPRGWKLDTESLMDRLGFCPIPVLFNQRAMRLCLSTNEFRLRGWRLPCSLGSYSSNPLVGQLLADFYSVEGLREPVSMILRPATGENSGNLAESFPRASNSQQLPWLQSKFPTFADVPFRGLMGEVPQELAEAGVKGILGSGRAANAVDLKTTPGTLQAAFLSGVASDKLYPIVWGVMLEPLEGCWHCSGIQVVAALSGFATDLTGERLIQDGPLSEWIARHRTILADWLEEPLGHLEQMSAGKMPSHGSTAAGAALGAVATLFIGTPFLAAHAAVLGGLAGAMLREFVKKRDQAKPNPELCQFFRTNLLEMQRQLRRMPARLLPMADGLTVL